MKYILFTLIIIMSFSSCKSVNNNKPKDEKELALKENDTVKISNPDMGYDVIIIEPGFNTWLQTQARSREFFTQQFLENKNIQYVTAWNNRVLQPSRYNPNLYELQINYQSGIDYGFEVNYKLYYYFVFFQNTYKQNLLGTRVPLN